MACYTPHCARPVVGDEAFCRACFRLVPPEHRDMLRMMWRSPFYAMTAWPWVDGTERGRVVQDGEWFALTGVRGITEALVWAERKMALQAVGKAVRRRESRGAARKRLLARQRR